MKLGLELVACALREGTMRPFIEAGIGHEWLLSEQDRSKSAIFEGADFHAWMTLLGHWDKHGKVMSLDMFRRSHPAESYPLPGTAYTPEELIEQWQDDRERFLASVLVSDLAALLREERYGDVVDLMQAGYRLVREKYGNQSIVVDWDDPSYDVESRIHREIRQGVLTGIPGLDDQFHGFQPAA